MLEKMATPEYYEGEEAAHFPWCSEASCPYPIASSERIMWLTGFQNERCSMDALE